MNQESLLTWYNRFEKLIERLPGPIQKVILGEIHPVKELFLEQRPPRILLLGANTVSRMEVVNSMFHEQLIPLENETPLPVGQGWETFRRVGRGSVLILDGRGQEHPLWQSGRDTLAPDVILFFGESEGFDIQVAQDIGKLEAMLGEIELKFKHRPAILAVAECAGHPARKQAQADFLGSALRSSPVVNKNVAGVVVIDRWRRFRADGTQAEVSDEDAELNNLMAAVIDELPIPAKLEMARISGVRSAQKKIADTLVKAVTAVSAAIGAQPIPLADMPILTGLQSGMVGGIIYISGGELNARSSLKFLGALGANIGVALVLRESVRALAKLVPGWGYLVSSAVAAGGTLAIGRAASGFFIDQISLADARKLFRRARGKQLPKAGNQDDR